MNVAQMIEDCKSKGIDLYLVNSGLKVRGDSELVKQVAPMLQKHKPAIIQYLQLTSRQWMVDTSDRGTIKVICSEPMTVSDILEAVPEAVSAIPIQGNDEPEHKPEEAFNDKGTMQHLEPFNFDRTHVSAETERINNMAWEFMQADGMTYAEAIRTASEIAAHCHIAPCEAAYEDVRALWERLKQAGDRQPNVS